MADCDAIDLGFVGNKGFEYFRVNKYRAAIRATDLGGKVTFLKARKLADLLIEYYLSGKADEVKIIYNEFKNAVSQRVLIEDFLPFGQRQLGSDESRPARDYIFKPSAVEVLENLLGRYFAAEAFRIMLESQAGEHGARMSAMENATKNADEMIRKLTLAYNKQRQAGITKELLEIIGGSESQNV